MLKCDNVQEMMSLYIDNQLNDVERISFSRHIKECSQCREELALLESIVKTCNELEDLELPIDFNEQLHQKLVHAQQTNKPVNPPWYLNWRMYSGLAAGILLIFVLKSQAFDMIYDSMQKTEKAYVNDAKLEYSVKIAEQATEEKMNGSEDNRKAMADVEDKAAEDKAKISVEQPKSAMQYNTMMAPEEKEQIKQDEPKQEMAPIAPASIPSVAMRSADSKSEAETGNENVDKAIKKALVCRGMYRDKKSLIVYNAVINTVQSKSEAIWKELQERLTQFDGYYELRFSNEKPIVYISKDKYQELISSVRSTGLEFTIDTSEVDETNRYQDLIAQCDSVQKRIEELRGNIGSTTKQEEIDEINKQLQILLEEQENLNRKINEMDSAIGKYIIEIHIVP